jgi:hypothetical protein
MRNLIGMVLTAAFVSGCATPIVTPVQSIKTEFNQPPIGQVVTASVGEELLKQGVQYTREVLILPQEVKVQSVFSIEIKKGRYVKIGDFEDSEFFSWLINRGDRDNGAIHSSGSPSEGFGGVALNKKTKELCVYTEREKARGYCTPNVVVERGTQLVEDRNSFQQTLLYNGRVGNKVNIGYRESYADRARQAFSNNVEYDLTDSRLISYREAQLEVIDATNQKITYKVLKNFAQPK